MKKTRIAASAHNDFYIAFVQSLFDNATTLAMGIVTQCAVILLAYYYTGDSQYFYIAGFLVAVGLARIFMVLRFSRSTDSLTYQDAVHREWIYIVFGTLHAAALGLFSIYSIYFVQVSFAEMASICLAFTTAVSIPGRNYGSSKMVLLLSSLLTLPIAFAMMARGDFAHIMLGILSLPFFFAVSKFSTQIRNQVTSLFSEQRKASGLAVRFDKALNTMSHGLLMLDAQETVIVANTRAADFFSLDKSKRLVGRKFSALIGRGVAAGLLDKRDARYISAELTRATREGRNRKVLVKLNDGRYFELSAREGDDELAVITFEDVSARIASQEKIRYMARFDSLTGLANRGYFQELVSDALADGDPERLCAIVVLDLDDFKAINDTLGHPVGDGLIFAFADRLANKVDENARLSRFGGDEFMIYFDFLEDEADLSARINALYRQFETPVDVAGNLLQLQVSAGAVMARAAESNVENMIVKADLALYKAKSTEKNSWQLFERALEQAFRERQKLKMELRGALERKELNVFYQPIVEAKTLRIASCEALCRWQHPELGNVPPSVFIPLAEEMGIIASISEYVLRQAVLDCVHLPDQVRVSVNLSAHDFRSEGIVQVVENALKFADLSSDRLEIEVTETALVDDKAKTWSYLQQMKALGVTIALDDFGTGYSNLGYLNSLPLDKIKVDRSFLTDIENNPRSLELLRGVVELSRRLRLKVTIEGVESEEQFRLLSSLVEPDYIQGYLFGTPLSKRGIKAMIEAVMPLSQKTSSKRMAS